MNRIETELPEVVIYEPKVFRDERGFFMETWNRERYRQAGLDKEFVQDNVSASSRGVLRGLHFQNPNAQGKLVYVLEGDVFDVAVDIRRGSPTFGRWFGCLLSGENSRQLYVPEGFAHGFCVLSERALFGYKCTDFYSRAAEKTLRWDDPGIGIDWPLKSPILSAKDAAALSLADFPPDHLPEYRG